MLFVFISQPDFACNCYALWKYITRNTTHKTAWLLRKRENLESLCRRGIRCELYDTVRGNELLAQADYVIANTVFPALPKTEGQVFVNLWHGSGVKAHDFSNPCLEEAQALKILHFSEITDLMCVHSLDDRYRLSAQLHYDLRRSVVTGQPRLDCIKTSKGYEKLKKIYNGTLSGYNSIIFFAPSFRANSSTKAGKLYSDNIFRMVDFDDALLKHTLESHNAAIIYKLHPIEQNALSGAQFTQYEHCFELTDEMLFNADIRYDEILNAFSLLITDYSSIAFDYLLLDRPIIYLVPDYRQYSDSQGFVFHNISFYMPGEKVSSFLELLSAIHSTVLNPDEYSEQRKNVIAHRFDFGDDRSAERCYNTIMNYKSPPRPQPADYKRLLPTNASLLQQYLPGETVIDSVLPISEEGKHKYLGVDKALYITEEIPDDFRSVSFRASTDIADLSFFSLIETYSNINIVLSSGGVDYDFFSRADAQAANKKTVIGYAGTIDCRIYFAMVQWICDAFPDYEIKFVGDIYGEKPTWLNSSSNLHYVGQVPYEEMPDIINSFDIALLPFYGRYKQSAPTELFQYLACGKCVITSDMPNLPDCKAIFKSVSVIDAVAQVRNALAEKDSVSLKVSAKSVAQNYDWKILAEKIKRG